MEAAFVVLVLVMAGAMVFTILKLREANARLARASTDTHAFEGRLEELRKELGAAREDAARKQKALEEARAEAKKRARREGKKMQREDEITEGSTDVSSGSREEVKRLTQTIAALEQQVATLQRELEERVSAARAEARAELEGQLAKAREETAAVQKTLDELRESVRRKAEERPDVPGTTLDLKALPTEAVQELARYFRKAEEFERLYGVASGRLQLAQERALDLQRRYYAVCRELALLTGSSEPASDEEARQAAEAVIDRTSPSTGSAPAGEAPAAGQAAAGEEGPKKKKRRRRRRKKKPGEAAAAEGAEGADDAEDGDEGDDDGDEGQEEAVSAAAEPTKPSEPSEPAASDAQGEPSNDEPRATPEA